MERSQNWSYYGCWGLEQGGCGTPLGQMGDRRGLKGEGWISSKYPGWVWAGDGCVTLIFFSPLEPEECLLKKKKKSSKLWEVLTSVCLVNMIYSHVVMKILLEWWATTYPSWLTIKHAQEPRHFNTLLLRSYNMLGAYLPLYSSREMGQVRSVSSERDRKIKFWMWSLCSIMLTFWSWSVSLRHRALQ